MTKKILLVGESWVSSATHYKGFDHFGSTTFHLGANHLVDALKDSEFDLTYMPAHEAGAPPLRGLSSALAEISLDGSMRHTTLCPGSRRGCSMP